MESKLQEKLFKKYPEIFGQKDLSMNQTCMCWGIEVGSGWAWLIDQLCNSIQRYVEGRNEGIRIRNEARKTELGDGMGFTGRKAEVEKEWQVEAVQIKEKYGGLRFYINGEDDIVDGMIHFAEHLSYHICESCGTTENVTVNDEGWISTLCKNCRQKKEEGIT